MPCEPFLHFACHTLPRTLTEMSCLLLEYGFCYVMSREPLHNFSCHTGHVYLTEDVMSINNNSFYWIRLCHVLPRELLIYLSSPTMHHTLTKL